MTTTYDAGAQAYMAGESERDCPHIDPVRRIAWLLGYRDTQERFASS